MIHLPLVASGSGTGGMDAAQQIRDLLRLIADDPEQRRDRVTTHAVLMAVAQARADDMARRDYISHVTPEGIGPNRHVREAGYTLPDWYPAGDTDNSIESIGGGFRSAATFWAALVASPGHRAHVLGLHAMYAAQTRVGIGWSYAPRSRQQTAWVLITCP